MPFRKRFVRRRSPRPRTRWVAITPAAVNGGSTLANNTQYFNALNLEDRQGTVYMNDYIGGTILRIILNLQLLPFMDESESGPATQFYYAHVGLFMDASDTPDPDIWNTNSPSGSYMIRDTMSHAAWYGSQAAYPGWVIDYGGPKARELTLDTQVKRRITENTFPFLGTYTFVSSGYTAPGSLAIGYTGRILIQLP